MKIKIKILSLFLSILFLLTACSNNNQNINQDDSNGIIDTSETKLVVYASFYPIYDFTDKIASDNIELNLIIPAGAEPHDYEISAKTMANLEQADLILLNGLDFEPWSDTLPKSLESKIIRLGERVNPLSYKEHSHSENETGENHEHFEFDPHIWLDPVRAIDMSSIIYETLSDLDAANKDVYKLNFSNLKSELEKLDTEFQELLSITNKKEVIVSHNAFSYIGERYAIDFHSISGISPENEPSLKALTEITDLVRNEDIKVIFFEELANEKIVKTLADEADVDSDVLYTIEGMTDNEINAGEDYFSKMRLNLLKLKSAVQ